MKLQPGEFRKHRLLTAAIVIITGILIYFPVFLHLDWWSYRAYDEATTGINSYSIYKSGNFLIPTNEGEPELWNCKPPFLLWCQVAFMKLIGPSELAVRLPTSISVVLLCVFFLFSLRYLTQNWLPGWLSTMVLITTPGYIANHVARTGDFDAMLSFFTCLYTVVFFFYLEESDKRKKDTLLVLFFVFLLLATFTKGIAALIFLPVLFALCLFEKKVTLLVKSSAFWLFSILYIILVGGYYYYRNYKVPGYFNAMLDNEILGRYQGGADDHSGLWTFYLSLACKQTYSYWLWFLSLPLFLMLFTPSRFKKFYTYLSLLIVFHHFVIARAVTKLNWYLAPEYPLLAMFIGLGMYEFCDLIIHSTKQKWAVILTFIIIVFGFPYNQVVHSVYMPDDYHSYPNELPDFGNEIRRQLRIAKEPDLYLYCGQPFIPDLKLQLLSQQEKGNKVHFLNEEPRDISNSRVIIIPSAFNQYIGNVYRYEIVKETPVYRVCRVFEKR